MFKTTLLAASLVASGIAHAAVTTGTLNFSWQGTIPAATVTTGNWKFTDALGADYIPSSVTLNFTQNADKSLGINSSSNMSFFITPDSGTLNGVDAYLASNPVSTGFVAAKQMALGTSASPAEDQVSILMNNQPLKVGSANKVTLAGANGTQAAVDISLVAKIAKLSFTENSVVGFSVPIIFAVDLT